MLCVQEDAWYAAASLVGSIASMGEAHIDGMGGMKLVKPLFLVLRRGGNDCKAAALRALQHLTTDRACRAMTARVRSAAILPPPSVLQAAPRGVARALLACGQQQKCHVYPMAPVTVTSALACVILQAVSSSAV